MDESGLCDDNTAGSLILYGDWQSDTVFWHLAMARLGT
jgi:hypothetical protein